MKYKAILITLLVPLLVIAQVDDVRIADIETNTTIEADKQASAAAHLSVVVCQKGFSGQIIEGGFTITNSDAFCDLIRLSEVMINASNVQKQMGNHEYAELYMTYYHQALEDANNLVSKTEYSSFIERVTSDLLIPLLLIIGAIILI